MVTQLAHLQQRRKSAAAWIASNEILFPGEMGVETDTPKWKLGDGVTGWNALPYQPSTASVAAAVAAQAAASATRWTANTAYSAGQVVVNPSGFVVTAVTSFTSGSAYSASNWSDPVAGVYATKSAETRATAVGAASTRAAMTGGDALIRRTLSELQGFHTWLNGASGYVGEFTVPAVANTTSGDSEKWQNLLDAFYSGCDMYGIHTTPWSSGTWLGASANGIGFYTNAAPGGADINYTSVNALVAERHPEQAGVFRGQNLSGLDFNGPRVSQNANWVPSTASIQYLAARNVKTVRLSATWENLQPALNGALDSTRLTLLNRILTDCANNGIKVVLELAHNYCRYLDPDGSTMLLMQQTGGSLNSSHLLDFWNKVAAWVESDPVRSATVHSYAIMNEPHDLNPSSATSQVTLCDFEDGTVQGWTVPTAPLTLTNDATEGATGTHSLKISPTGANYGSNNFFTISRSIAAAPQGTAISMQVKMPTGVTGASAYMQLVDQNGVSYDGSSAGLTDGAWSTVTIGVPAGTTTVNAIKLVVQSINLSTIGTSPIKVDNVQYAAIDTPARVWEKIAQDVVTGLRTAGHTRTLVVPTYSYSQMHLVATSHPSGPWLTDTANNVIYEAHSYWSLQRNGQYKGSNGTSPETYAEGVAQAATSVGTFNSDLTSAFAGKEPAGLSSTTLATLSTMFANLPVGGTDGQILMRSGGKIVWGTISGGGTPTAVPTAVSVVGTVAPATSANGATSVTLTVPAHLANDRIVLIVGFGATSGQNDTIAVPSGFTSRVSTSQSGTTSWVKVMDAPDASNAISTVTVTRTDTAGSLRTALLVLRGVSTTSPIIRTDKTSLGNGQSSSPGITFGAALPVGSLAVVAANSASGHTETTGWTDSFVDLSTPGDTTTMKGATKAITASETPAATYGASASQFWAAVGVAYAFGS